MSDRFIPVLSFSCATLVVSYVALVVATIFFAAAQTQEMGAVRSTESAIGNLEASYYSTVNQLGSLDPSALGYVQPAQVEYVTEILETSSGLSFAGN